MGMNEQEVNSRETILGLAEQGERHHFNQQIQHNRFRTLVELCLKQDEAISALQTKVKALEAQIATKELPA